MAPRIHPTAIVEQNVTLGQETSVWDHVHIRAGASLGEQCIVGGKSYIAYDVKIGDRVKINSNVYICHGVQIDDGVMVAAGVIFTNDRYPRATTPDLKELLPSDPTEQTLLTRVGQGTTIGAGAIIGPGITIGCFAMIAMGSVVTKDVPAFALVMGNPATIVGFVCRCGHPVIRGSQTTLPTKTTCQCICGRQYQLSEGLLSEDE